MSASAVAGEWQVLVARLDRFGVPARWAQAEAALSGLVSAAQLREWTAPGRPAAADGVLGALVRLAAVGGGADADAVLVLVHLLWPSLVRTVIDVRATFGPDTEAVVAAALVERIRIYPISRRTRAFAANLQRDTRRMVIAEVLDRHREQPLDSSVLLARAGRTIGVPVNGTSVGLDAHALLRWALREGVVSAADVSLLRHLMSPAEAGSGGPRVSAAELLGVSVRTVERQRDRALASLQTALPRYLRAAA